MQSDDGGGIKKLFSGLRDRDYAREGLFVCEGRLVIEKALAAGIRLRALVCVPADEALWLGALAAAGQGDLSPRAMGRPELAELVGFAFHRGAIALAERPAMGVAGVARDAGEEGEESRGKPGNELALWNVTDPDNLGALIRSAAALGASRVCLGPGCADPLGRKALRSSMGCALSLPLRRVADVAELRRAGPGTLIAAALDPRALSPAQARRELDSSGNAATLVLGNEGWGLPDEVVVACDAVVALPMANGVDSLNVGAAGAILMWELFRRFD